ncbi:MAG: glycogen debranching enzyme, partial [Enterobacterales bacterium]|nr:glycogen debranching enzyme [Enterobacterales bacterium]
MLKPGNPGPLGAHITPEGVNFALFSSHATRVELCIFDKTGHQESYELPARSGDVWHGLLPGAKAGVEYGYRVHGSWRPEKGQRFNP